MVASSNSSCFLLAISLHYIKPEECVICIGCTSTTSRRGLPGVPNKFTDGCRRYISIMCLQCMGFQTPIIIIVHMKFHTRATGQQAHLVEVACIIVL